MATCACGSYVAIDGQRCERCEDKALITCFESLQDVRRMKRLLSAFELELMRAEFLAAAPDLYSAGVF